MARGSSVQTVADLLLLDIRRVQQYGKEGVFKKESHGRYDTVACVQAYIRILRDQAKGRDPDRVKEEKALIAENRRLKELTRLQMEGSLVDAKEVQRELVNHITSAKARLRSVPAKVAQEITHLKMAGKSERELTAAVQGKLLTEIDSALEDVSQWKPSKS